MRGISIAALVLALLEVEAVVAGFVARQDAGGTDSGFSSIGASASASVVASAGASESAVASTSEGVPTSLGPSAPAPSDHVSSSTPVSASTSAVTSASASASAPENTIASASGSASVSDVISASAAASASASLSGSASSSASPSPTWSEPPVQPAHTGVTRPGVAFNFTGMNLTYYYDNTMPPHKACAAVSGGNDWSIPIVKNPSACGHSISDLHTDNVVALNVSWLNQDAMSQRADLCGREVEIWSGGRKLDLPTLFLYEACAACASMPRADVSVGTYISATGDTECQRGTVGGFDVLVLDKKVDVGVTSGASRAAGIGGGGLLAAVVRSRADVAGLVAALVAAAVGLV